MHEPWSQEAEQGVLGSMLINPELIDILAMDLKPSDFFFSYNQAVYKAITDLRAKERSVDVLTVSDEIGTLDNGEPALPYVVDLHRNTPSAANAKEYVRIVQARSVDRDLIKVSRIIEEIAASAGDAQDKIGRAQAEIMGVQGQTMSAETLNACEALREHMEELERRESLAGAMDGLSTGIKALDDHLHGLKEEQLIIIAGRPKMGKTTLAQNICDHIGVTLNEQVLAVSLEMSTRQLMDKSIAHLGSIPLDALKSGSVFKSHAKELSETTAKIAASGLTFYKRKSATINQIRAAARRHKLKHGLKVLLVDHIGLVDIDDHKASPVQRISEITRALKLLAKELGCVVIALSQLSRALEQRPNKRPIPSDLRDSGSIEQDADVILFVYRDEVYNEHTECRGVAEIIIGAIRDGEPGTVRARYQGKYSSFSDMLSEDEYRELSPKPTRSYAKKSLLD
jgi:replicative DNA helicase